MTSNGSSQTGFSCVIFIQLWTFKSHPCNQGLSDTGQQVSNDLSLVGCRYISGTLVYREVPWSTNRLLVTPIHPYVVRRILVDFFHILVTKDCPILNVSVPLIYPSGDVGTTLVH